MPVWLLQNYLTRGFWGDEAWTALISSLPLKEILRVTGEDFHPPLYYFIVHFWGGIFGFGEVAVRLISLFFFLLTPFVVFHLSRLLFGFKQKTLHWVFAVLVLLSPILFTYAFEARAYALLTFLTVCSAYALWRARTEKRHTWRVLYFIFGAMSVYTHYYSWFILASHGLYILLFDRKYLRRLLLPAVGILLVQLPWLPTLFGQVGQVNKSYWIAPINSRTHLEFFLRIAGGDAASRWQEPVAWLVTALVLVSLFYRVSRKKITSEYKFIWMWLLIPTLLPTIISLKIPIFFYRYLIFSAIPLLFLAVDGLARLPKRLGWVGMFVIVASYGLINASDFLRYPRSMREVRAEVYNQKQPGDGPVYTVLPSFAEVMYYFEVSDAVKVLPEGLVQFSGKSLLDSFVRQGRTEITQPTESIYWLLSPGPMAEFVP